MTLSNYFFSRVLNNLKETVASVEGLGPVSGGAGTGDVVFIGVPEREPGAETSAYLFISNGSVSGTTLSGLIMSHQITVRIFQRYRGGSREDVELKASDLAYRVLFAIASDPTIKGTNGSPSVRSIEPLQMSISSSFSGDFNYRVFDITVGVIIDKEGIF